MRILNVSCFVLYLSAFFYSPFLFGQKPANADFSSRWDSLKWITHESFYHGSLPLAKRYALQLYNLSQNPPNDSLKIIALGILGVVETDPQLTTRILEEADSAAAAFGNTSMRAQTMSNLIVHLNATGNVKKAYSMTRDLVEIARSTGNPDALTQAYMGLSQMYALIQDYPKTIDALYRLRNALETNVRDPNLLAMRLSETYIALGMNYSKSGNQDSAFYYIRLGIERAKKDTIIAGLLRGNIELARYYGQIAESQPDQIPRMKAALDSAAQYLSLNDWGLHVYYRRTLANYYLLSGVPQRCIVVIDSLLPEAYKNNDLANQCNYQELLYKSYEKLNNTALAYQHFKLFSIANDSLNQNQIKYNLSIYEVDKHVTEREIENLKLGKQSEFLRLQVTWLAWGIGIVALLTLMIAVFGLQWRKQANRNARLNEALRASEQALLQSNTRLDRFASTVSHDLLANLDIVLSSANAIAEKTDQINALQFFYKQAGESARRMKTYCLEMLESAKKEQPGSISTDLEKITDQVIAQFLPQIEQHGIQIEKVNLATVPAAPVLLHQALQNLMSNALKYGISTSRKPIFRISSKELNDAWEIRFSDNGPGIPSNLKSLLLSQNILQNTGKDHESNGIGLYLTKKSLESAGYDLSLDTRDESGASFCIAIPKPNSGTVL